MLTKPQVAIETLLAILGVPTPEKDAGLLVPASRRALSSKTAAQIEARSQVAGLPTRFAFSRPLFSGFQVFHAPKRDWVLVNGADDPLSKDPDGFPVPASILGNLERLNKVGVDFPAIYIAHEVEKGKVTPGMRLTADLLTPPGPAQLLRTSKKFGENSAPLWAAALAPLRAAGVMAGAVVSGIAMISMDPIVFGVSIPFGFTAAAGVAADWYYLGHWTYNAEEGKHGNR